MLGVLVCLKRERVDVLFGLPDDVLLPLYDAIYHSDIRHYLGWTSLSKADAEKLNLVIWS